MMMTKEEYAALQKLKVRVARGEVSDYYDVWLYRLASFILDNAGALLLWSLLTGLSIALLLAALLFPVS